MLPDDRVALGYRTQLAAVTLLFSGLIIGCSVGLHTPAAPISTKTEASCVTVRGELDAAATAVQKGSGKEAEAKLQKAVARAPDCGRGHLLLAMVLREKLDLTRALEEVRAATRLAPSDPVTYNVSGNIYAALASRAVSPQESRELLLLAKTGYERALRADSSSVKLSSAIGLLGVYVELEKTLRRLGDHTEADLLRTEIEAFLKANPQTRDALKSFDLRRATSPPVRVQDKFHPLPKERAERLQQSLGVSE
ncbi:MAG: tetratricopeptide repeat protein [Nitrososphaera sp.]|nr:tetratricopeptide repeat protein [Nitrososphaera sp.]